MYIRVDTTPNNDIDNEVADMRDLLRQHIMLSDRGEQLKPLGLGKNKCYRTFKR
jgi:hypothetical protein